MISLNRVLDDTGTLRLFIVPISIASAGATLLLASIVGGVWSLHAQHKTVLQLTLDHQHQVMQAQRIANTRKIAIKLSPGWDQFIKEGWLTDRRTDLVKQLDDLVSTHKMLSLNYHLSSAYVKLPSLTSDWRLLSSRVTVSAKVNDELVGFDLIQKVLQLPTRLSLSNCELSKLPLPDSQPLMLNCAFEQYFFEPIQKKGRSG